MNNEKKLKILLIGPVSTGKTTIANFLSDSNENSTGDNRPTKGVRILEFVVQGVKTKGIYQRSVDVELWDCSGDNRADTLHFYSSPLPAIPAGDHRTRLPLHLELCLEYAYWSLCCPFRYETCWPAMQHAANGIVFVYSEASNQQRSALNKLYNYFVEEARFPDNCCFIVKNQLSDEEGGRFAENPLPNLNHAVVNLEVKGAEFKKSFSSFLSAVVKSGS
ncbi:hypothetical protein RUM43_009193 [Polyplax serrata]|uniref:Intraflagellar transport protein 22 homolog n=1 Tax=Polyplax serrata TaxID=468196 RepID=A0AAN8S101_POLSC